MTTENKLNWRCNPCWEKIRSDENNQAETPCNYVNHQRPKYKINISVENSFESLSNTLSDDDDVSLTEEIKLNRSCPDLRSKNDGEDIKEIRSKLEILEEKLKIADNEIENLLSENSAQRKIITEYEKKVKMLTQICNSDSKKRSRKASQNKTSLNKTKLDFTREESSNELDKEAVITDTPSSEKMKDVKNKQTGSQKQAHPRHPLRDLPIKNKIGELEINKISRNEENIVNKSDIHRIHIFADDQGRGLCRQLSNLLGRKYKVYSEVKPGASTENVLKDMKQQCHDYGKSDCIIIVTGENDNIMSKLSSYLYYKLSEQTTTNIILCQPRRNKQLNMHQLNDAFKSLSKELPHVKYLDLRYCYLGLPQNNFKHLSRNILQEILRVEYNNKIVEYRTKYIHNMLRKSQIHQKNYSKSKTNCAITESRPQENTSSIDVEPDKCNEFFRG